MDIESIAATLAAALIRNDPDANPDQAAALFWQVRAAVRAQEPPKPKREPLPPLPPGAEGKPYIPLEY